MATAGNETTAANSRPIQRLVKAASAQGSPDRYTGKRRWPRFRAAIPLEITTDPTNPSAAAQVTMQNVSEGGLAFWLRRELREHTGLFVRECTTDGSCEWIPARVRHCRPSIHGYLVGAEFASPSADAPVPSVAEETTEAAPPSTFRTAMGKRVSFSDPNARR